MLDDELELEFEDEAPKPPTPVTPVSAPKAPVQAVSPTVSPTVKAAPRPVVQAAAPATPRAVPTVHARPVASAPAPVARLRTAPESVGSSALRLEPMDESFSAGDGTEVVELREQLKRVEFESQVKIEVADFKTEIMGELLGDIKLMEYKVNQMLSRIHAKHPDMKQEVLMIKKIMAEFSSKKRK